MARTTVALFVVAALGAACSQTPISPTSSGSSASGLAASAAKPPRSTPVTVLFRCPGSACAGTDRILADGFDASYGTADGASLDGASEFMLALYTGLRSLGLDFTDVAVPCNPGPCLRTFNTISISASESSVFHTNTINPATGGLASNGLMSIPVGQTWPSRLKIAFNTRDAKGIAIPWAVRYNPTDYPGSTLLHVTRVATDTWIIEATTSDLAMLAREDFSGHGHLVQVNEGLYRMPFKLTVQTQ